MVYVAAENSFSFLRPLTGSYTMGQTREDLAAMAARLAEKRKMGGLHAEKVTAEKVKAFEKKQAAEKLKPLKKTLAGDDELWALTKLVEELQKTLRVADDKVLPPVLRRLPRFLREEAKAGHKTGVDGPRYPELAEIRIQAVRLVCYQYRCGRQDAFEWLESHVKETSVAKLRHSFYDYATDEEIAENPYSGEVLTYLEIEPRLTEAKVALVGDYLPYDPMPSLESYTFRCLEVEGHPTWTTLLTRIFVGRSRCRKCGRIQALKTRKANKALR